MIKKIYSVGDWVYHELINENNYVTKVSIFEGQSGVGIFTGTYLREDYKKATQKARRLFSGFEIVPLNTAIAEIIGQINAYLITKGFPAEYQDVAIAATFLYKKGEF